MKTKTNEKLICFNTIVRSLEILVEETYLTENKLEYSKLSIEQKIEFINSDKYKEIVESYACINRNSLIHDHTRKSTKYVLKYEIPHKKKGKNDG